MSKKVLSIIFSLMVIVGLGFSITWGVINFNRVKEGMANTGVYTIEDINKSYEDGFNKALTNKGEYEDLINGYRDTIISLNDAISQLNSQSDELIETNKDYEIQVSVLSRQKAALESTVSDLQNAIASNNKTINSLNSQIAVLETQAEQIPTLNSQIASIQSTVNLLQAVNTSNAATITNLNNQIIGLNSQINGMTVSSQSASSQIAVLNNRIKEYEASIAYYENFIAQLENNNKVVATYEFGNSIWKIEILNKGSIINLASPTNTETKIFNGWKVAGQDEILGDTYVINDNTKFVADITYIYPVSFVVDEQSYDEQNITQNNSATVPTVPTKEGYTFDGWTINGTDIVDVENYAINSNTVFIAKFTIKSYEVTFKYENTIVETESVNYGFFAKNVVVNNSTYKIFNGWKLNGVNVDISTIQIKANTEFVADIIYCYDVTFVVDNETYNTQVVANNGYAIIPENPNKIYYDFDGWTLNNELVNVNNIAIKENVTFVAKFTKLHTVTFMNGVDVCQTQHIKNGECSTPVNVASSDHLIFNGWTLDGENVVDVSKYVVTSDVTFNAKCSYTKAFVQINDWNIVIKGEYIWYYGNEIYYSKGSEQFKYNPQTNLFDEVTWNGLKTFYGRYIRKIAGRYYYMNNKSQYRLEDDTKTWVKIEWKVDDTGFKFSPVASNTFQYGEECFHLSNGWCYRFNPESLTVSSVTIQIDGTSYEPGATSLYGSGIWKDGNNYFYQSTYQLVSTHNNFVINFVTKNWVNPQGVSQSSVVKINGDNYYIGAMAQDNHLVIYKIDVEGGRMDGYDWIGVPDISYVDGCDIWSIGSVFYYSSNNKQYIVKI